ncbi:unnamed protein product, partial [Ectocarpus sp. 13 AM-2016]
GHNTGTNTSNNRGSTRCLEAIAVVLNQSSPKGGIREPPFISSTLQLQLACLELCAVCRSLPSLHIKVPETLPASLWVAATSSDDAGDHDNGVQWQDLLSTLRSLRRWYPRGDSRRRDGVTLNRVPPLLPFSVTCGLSSLPRSSSSRTADLWTGVERLRLEFSLSETSSWKDSSVVMLPRRLKQLLFVSSSFVPNFQLPVAVLSSPPPLLLKLFVNGSFEVPVVDVPWPPSLTQLSFGARFQQRLGRGGAGSAGDGDGDGGVIKWPVHLQQLSFWHHFQEPIAEINWPASLERLAFFGPGFNEPLDGVVSSWPSLRKLVLGNTFNQPIAQVSWPASLRALRFGDTFNQPIAQASWPASLQELSLGGGFDGTVEEVIWPSSLRKLDLGKRFSHPIARATWPASLEELAFGGCEGRFNQPIAQVAWPPSLRAVRFGEWFNQSIDRVSWPNGLQELYFGGKFNQLIAQASWPASLRELAFGTDFNQPIDQVSWPASLQKLSFGKYFNHPIAHVSWPGALRELIFGERFDQRFGEYFNQPIAQASWPDALQEIKFGGDFSQRMIGTNWPMSLRKIYISKRSASGNRGSGRVSALCGNRELSLFCYV